MRIGFKYLHLAGIFMKVTTLFICETIFSLCVSIYFSITRIRKYLKNTFIHSIFEKFHVLDYKQ